MMDIRVKYPYRNGITCSILMDYCSESQGCDLCDICKKVVIDDRDKKDNICRCKKEMVLERDISTHKFMWVCLDCNFSFYIGSRV